MMDETRKYTYDNAMTALTATQELILKTDPSNKVQLCGSVSQPSWRAAS
jgi:hypothetical protein